MRVVRVRELDSPAHTQRILVRTAGRPRRYWILRTVVWGSGCIETYIFPSTRRGVAKESHLPLGPITGSAEAQRSLEAWLDRENDRGNLDGWSDLSDIDYLR